MNHVIRSRNNKSLNNKSLKGRIVLVWGNGSFGPTSHGRRAAPNAKLAAGLSFFFPIVYSSEYLTSKRSPCCHAPVVHGYGGTSKTYRKKKRKLNAFFKAKCEREERPYRERSVAYTKKIRGLFHCNAKLEVKNEAGEVVKKVPCKKSWNRDVAAPLNIRTIFLHKCATGKMKRPDAFITKKENRINE